MLHEDLLEEHLPQASHFFHLLMFSAFQVLGNCQCLHNHHENGKPDEKPYYGPLWTSLKFHSKSKYCGFPCDFCRVKFRSQCMTFFFQDLFSTNNRKLPGLHMIMYDFWSKIVTVPDPPAGSISRSCYTNIRYTIHTMNTRAFFQVFNCNWRNFHRYCFVQSVVLPTCALVLK